MEPITLISTGQRYGTAQRPSPGAAAPEQGSSPEDRTARAVDGQGLRLPEDRVTLSGNQREQTRGDGEKEAKAGEKTAPSGKNAEDPEVQQTVERLKRIEEKVKAHEAAHKAAGGSLAGSASYSYTQGPDGRSYITGGEVQIDMSGGNTPEETITRMQQVIRAALAPSDPSGQDRAVAAQAAGIMAQAQQEKLQAADPAAPSEADQPPAPSAAAAGNPSEPATGGTSPSATSAANNRIQQAYGNSAVQAVDRNSTAVPPFAPDNRSPGISRIPEDPLFSSFA